MRRIGKTSVVNVAVNESWSAKLRINLFSFRLYNPAKKQFSKEEFLSLLIQTVNDAIKNYTLL